MANAVVGFLSIVTDATGVFGGYLVTNAWGRPLEFRLTTAVQPNRVQQILYGPTLTEYLHAELIGKTPLQALDLWMAEANRQGLYILLDFHSVSMQRQPSWPGR